MPARAPPAPRSAISPSSFASPAGTRPTRCSSCTSSSPARAAVPRSAARLLELVALSDAAKRRVDGMSKGMQQRLGIAQALVGEPRLLLLDEPTSALDPVGRRTVRLLLEELRAQGVSVLLNSHLLSEVELVCDRVTILLAGEVVAAGTPAELSRPRGVEIETDDGVQTIRGRDARGRAAARRRGGRGRAAACTACASSRRRSKRPISKPSAVRRTELGRRHRRVRLPRGRAAQGVRGRHPADRRLPVPVLAREPLRVRPALARSRRRATSTSTRARSRERSSWASRCSRRSSSASCSRCS